MAENSGIAWTTHTFNPWIGCTKISPACDRCYAEEWAKRYAKDVTWGKPGQHAKLRRTKTWKDPLAWNRRSQAQQTLFAGERPRVFCASLADIFDKDAPPEWRADLFGLVAATPYLDWLLLTKRPQNIKDMLPSDWGDGWPNVWLGTTVENQEEANRRVPHLLQVPARVRFLSCEPLLGPVSLRWLGEYDAARQIHWVIIGGESGSGFRPMSMEWVAGLRVQCRDANVPVFFKQDSSIKPGCKGRASPELWACKQFPRATPTEGGVNG